MPKTPPHARRRPILLLAGALLLLPGLPLAQAAPDGPHVSARALGAAPLAGRLVGLDAKALHIAGAAGDTPRAVELDRVIEVRFPAPSSAAPGVARLRVHLVGGDALVGVFAGPSEEGIRLDVPGLKIVAVSFEVIRTIEALPADAGPCHHPADKDPPAEVGDIVYDTRDDEFRGTVLEATDKELALETQRGRRRSVHWQDLRVAHLQNDALPQLEGLQAEVELWGGSRIAAAGSVGYTSAGLSLSSRSLAKVEWKVPFNAVRAVRWWGGRFVYASALPFRSTLERYHVEPRKQLDLMYLDWYDASVDRRRFSRCPLRLGGETYRRGFGVNSHSTIEIDLNGAYKTFRAGFGIDDEVLTLPPADGRRGNVDARVLGDGKVLWEAKDVKGGQQAKSVGPLDVSSVKTLVLEVGFGKDMMMRDRADWVDPILERK